MDTHLIGLDILMQISDQSPRAIAAYVLAVSEANEQGYAHFDKKLITDKHSQSWTKFRNDLRGLARIGLLSWNEDSSGINIFIHDFETHDYDDL